MLDDKLSTRREAPESHSRLDWNMFPSKTATTPAVPEPLLLFCLAVDGMDVTGKEEGRCAEPHSQVEVFFKKSPCLQSRVYLQGVNVKPLNSILSDAISDQGRIQRTVS